MKSTDLVPAFTGLAGLEENSTKEQWHLPALLPLEKVAPISAPLVLTLNLVNSIPLYVPGTFLAAAPVLLFLSDIIHAHFYRQML